MYIMSTCVTNRPKYINLRIFINMYKYNCICMLDNYAYICIRVRVYLILLLSMYCIAKQTAAVDNLMGYPWNCRD